MVDDVNYYDFTFFTLIFLLFVLNNDFLETDLVRPDKRNFYILWDYSDTVLLANNVALSSIFLALANSLFSISLDLLLDFDNRPCFENFGGLNINNYIFFV